MLRYGSVCSGIEAATLAWHGIGSTMCMTCEGLGVYNGHACGPCKGRGFVGGWEPAWFAEIEKFPSAVLAHHHPDVPNLGDFTKLHLTEEFHERPIDLLVGGTPCQSFSVAGLRKGLDDARGNLALHFVALAARSGARWLLWENVPGVLSSSQGRDFAAFLGALAGRDLQIPRRETVKDEGGQPDGTDTKGWTSCGIIEPAGPGCYGLAWRVLDAQYFGVAQRRRRVFVVGYLGDWRPAAAVLFERASLQGDPAPSRQKGQGFAFDVAPSIGASGQGTARTGETRGQDPVIGHTLRANHDASEDGPGRGTPLVPVQTYGGNNTAGPIDVATAVNAKGGSGRQDFETETFAVMAIQDGRAMKKGQNGLGLNDDGTAYTVDTTGSQAVAQPIGFQSSQSGIRLVNTHATLDANNGSRRHNGVIVPAPPPPPVAFKVRGGVEVDSNGKSAGKGYLGSEETAFTIAATQDQWLAQPQQAFGMTAKGTGEVFLSDTHTALSQGGGQPGQGYPAALVGMAVRRLTPRECERLQGFPDDYTLIPYRGKPAADGPRYKALGNSMARPVMTWIGKRIQMVEEILRELK